MEYFDIVDEQNNLVGKTEERDIVHKLGMYHREVAVWIMNEKGEILLQKRSATKKQGPNMWSICAGHIDSGEKIETAALREIGEELGIIVQEKELEFLFIQKVENTLPTSKNNMFQYIFFLRTNVKLEEYTINLEELSQIKYISLNELEKLIIDKPSDYPFASRLYMPNLLEQLKKRL